MKFLDKVEPIFNIDNEMELLINIIDKKLNEIEINDKQKRILGDFKIIIKYSQYGYKAKR